MPTNTDPDTGIAYGVISARDVHHLEEEILEQGTDITYQNWLEETQDSLLGAIKSCLGEDAGVPIYSHLIAWLENCHLSYAGEDLARRMWETWHRDIHDEEWFDLIWMIPQEAIVDLYDEFSDEWSDSLEFEESTYELETDDGGKYGMSYLGGARMIWVFKSPIVTWCTPCSPCVPGAGDLNNCVNFYMDEGPKVKTYAVPKKYFENSASSPYKTIAWTYDEKCEEERIATWARIREGLKPDSLSFSGLAGDNLGQSCVAMEFDRDDVMLEVHYPSVPITEMDDMGFEIDEDLDLTDEDGYKELAEQFSDSGAFEDWRNSFDIMTYNVWPVDLCNVGIVEATDLMHHFAPNTVLFSWEDDDQVYIGLTGCGMDMTWDLAAAYMCCGQLPPMKLTYLPKFAGHPANETNLTIIEACIESCNWAESQASRRKEQVVDVLDWMKKQQGEQREPK